MDVGFIRFTHGGTSDTQLTNSSVVICPAAERLRCTKSNLLKNPSAQDGLRGWKIVRSGGEWVTAENCKPLPDTVTTYFVTSYGVCLKQQLIDLEKEGYSDAFMDEVQPHIKISDWAGLTNRNLLKNPSAQSGFEGWEIVQNGGHLWVTSENNRTFPVSDCFVTSYGLCLKQQLIDLEKEGYNAAFMDQQQPHIKISDWYAPRSDCGSEYQICVELLDEKKKPIRTFEPEKVFFQQGKSEPWTQMTHVFMDYGPGVRFIRFTHGGKDTKSWKGQHGIQVTYSSVEIYPV